MSKTSHAGGEQLAGDNEGSGIGAKVEEQLANG